MKYVHLYKEYCKVCQYILPVIMKISIIIPYHNIRLLNMNNFKMSILPICLSQEKSFVRDDLYWVRNLYLLSNLRLLTFNLVISNGNLDPNNYRPSALSLNKLTSASYKILTFLFVFMEWRVIIIKPWFYSNWCPHHSTVHVCSAMASGVELESGEESSNPVVFVTFTYALKKGMNLTPHQIWVK